MTASRVGKRKPGSKAALPAAPHVSGERRASVHEAKTHLSRLLNDVAAGRTVIITRRGEAVARLEAIVTRPKRVFGSMKGQIGFDDSFFDPLPDDELALWGEV